MDNSGKFMVPSFLAPFLLRIGLAVVFLYAAIASFIEPDAWIGYMPVVLQRMLSESVLLGIFSVIQIALSVWLLWGKKSFYSGAIASIMLLGIIIANFGAMDIVFRDFGILFAALALMALSWSA